MHFDWPLNGPLVFRLYECCVKPGGRCLIKRFLQDRRGATSLEYGMIAAIVSIVIVAATMQIGIKLNTKLLGPVGGGLN